MMKYLFSTTLVLLFFSMILFGQSRNTLWLDGLNATSKGWGRTPQDMQNNHGYDLFRVISLEGLDNTTYDPSLGVEGAATRLTDLTTDYPNILGLGHDYGGLVLRAMANEENHNLTAMILNGVPNQGSSAIATATGIDSPDIDVMLKSVKDIKADENCTNCNYVEAFERWIDHIRAVDEISSEMATNSPVINRLSNNPPAIPYAVLWGSVEELSLTSLLSSRAFQDEVDAYSRCYAAQFNLTRERANDALIGTVYSNFSFANNVKSFIRGLADGLSFINILSNTASFISEQREEIVSQITVLKERDRELARILKCDLAEKFLATQWEFILSRNGDFETATIEVPAFGDCTGSCKSDCEDGGGQPGSCFANCMSYCLNDKVLVDVTVTIENDGLLTKREQMLPGAAFEYHLYDHNHFQESRLSEQSQQGNLNDALQELFDGTAGSAFIIPQ